MLAYSEEMFDRSDAHVDTFSLSRLVKRKAVYRVIGLIIT
jgi:hypothetical protein